MKHIPGGQNAPSPALLDFVLGHLHVDSTPGSLQRCEDGSFGCERRTIGETNLIYVTRGRVAWTIKDQQHVLTPGSLLLSPLAVPHHAVSLTRRITLLSLHLIATLPGGQDVFDLLRPPEVQQVQPGSRLDDYLRAAMSEYDRDDPVAIRQSQHDWSALITRELLREGTRLGLLEARPADPRVADVLDVLESRIAKPTSQQDIVALSGFSAQHLNRLFRRTLGMTPLQHLTHRRMQLAAELLVRGHLSVAAIARRVGYEDQFYFSRLFKQHFGKSPLRYRQEADS